MPVVAKVSEAATNQNKFIGEKSRTKLSRNPICPNGTRDLALFYINGYLEKMREVLLQMILTGRLNIYSDNEIFLQEAAVEETIIKSSYEQMEKAESIRAE